MKEYNLKISPTRKSNLTVDKIREYYPALAANGDPWIIPLYEEIYSQQILTEFITRTIDKKIVVRNLKARFSGKFEEVYTQINHVDGLWIKFNEDEHQYQYIKEIHQYIEAMGWYPAYVVNEQTPWYDDIKKIRPLDDYMLINYLEKYDTEVSVPKYIYHLIPDIHLKKILQIGLTPKNKTKLSNNPEHIYFLLPATNNMFMKTAKALHKYTKNKSIKKWHVLRIDTDRLPTNIKFYNDPMFTTNAAVWTFQNIPPVAISQYLNININEK